MDRTSAANYIDIGGGRRGHRDRNTAAGLPGTRLSADFLNDIQEELLALVEGTGQTANTADQQQLWQGVRRLAGRQVRVVTANATLDADDGLVLIDATAGSIVITLPSAAALAGTVAGVAKISSQQLTLVRTDTSGNTVTLQRAGSDKLGRGTAVNYLMTATEVLRIASTGTDTWRLVSCSVLGRREQTLTGSGNWTVPAWVDFIDVEFIGGGGGGGGNTTQGGAGGGGAGGRASGSYVVTGGQVIAYAIGAAGTAGVNNSGTAAGNNGGDGGASTFGSLVAAAGGQGGRGSVSNGQGASGQGGNGTTGTNLRKGGDGNAGFWISGTNAFGGMGGSAPCGGGGGAASTGLPTAGGFPGGGGGGGANNFAGGAGAAGTGVVRY